MEGDKKMNFNDIDIVPMPEEYKNFPLTRFFIETNNNCNTTMEWLQKVDYDTLVMIAECGDIIRQFETPPIDINKNDDFWHNYNIDDFMSVYQGEKKEEYLDNATKVNDYALLAIHLCLMELERVNELRGKEIDEELMITAIQFLYLWAVFEQLRRKELIVISGDGMLLKYYTTFFNLSPKGELVHKYMMLKYQDGIDAMIKMKDNNVTIKQNKDPGTQTTKKRKSTHKTTKRASTKKKNKGDGQEPQ